MGRLSDKILIYTGITLEIIILAVGIFALKSDSTEAADIIQAVCSIINLIVVIIFFIVSDMFRKKEIKNSNKQYWFKKYIVSEFLPVFDNFFNKINETVRIVKNEQYKDDDEKENKLEELLNVFSNDLKIIIQNFYPKIAVISPELAKKIEKELQRIEDEYSKTMELIIFLHNTSKLENASKLEEEISKGQTQIFQLFYKYGEEIDFM